MKKGVHRFLRYRDGKVNLSLIIISVVLFTLALYTVSASDSFKIALFRPGDSTFNGSRKINFTFNVTSTEADTLAILNCSIYTNITGTWAVTAQNSTGQNISLNGSLSWINVTLSRDGLFKWGVNCTNATGAGISNFSITNRTLTVDNSSPVLFAFRPNSTVAGDTGAGVGYGNLSSYGDLEFYVNVSDNTTSFVWYVLNQNLAGAGAGTNQSHWGVNGNRTMSEIRSDNGRAMYNGTLNTRNTSIFNFSSPYTSPGPHSVFFCANDTIGRKSCIGPYDFFIIGTNITQMEDILAGAGQPGGGSVFGGLNITYGNGSDVPEGTWINPLTAGINFTFVFNFSKNAIVHIVGGRIDDAQLGNATQSQINSTPNREVSGSVGSRMSSQLAWADIASFIPNEVSYEYGIIQIGGIGFQKKMYCNGTSMGNPLCHTINVCNSTAFGIFNHTTVIPQNDACWLDSSVSAVVINNFTMSSGYTYIFVDKFSGGLGGSDFSQVNITFTNPPIIDRTGMSAGNRSTTVFQVINFTLSDINSTGMNLSLNNSINVSVFLGSTVVGFFSYINVSNATNITCITPDIVSPDNATTVHCNLTINFNSNGTYFVNVTARDASNNSNPANTTTSNFTLLIDTIPPRQGVFIISNSSTLNITNVTAGKLGDEIRIYNGTDDGAIVQGGKISVVSNWTDNLTAPFTVELQFYNVTSEVWITANTTADATTGVNVTPSQTNTPGWANFSFVIPKEHNIFEGENVTFRLVANDSAGAGNFTGQVKNLSVLVNDTLEPRVVIAEPSNGSNLTTTVVTVTWNITERNDLSEVNVSIDGIGYATPSDPNSCLKFREWEGITSSNLRANFSYTTSSDSLCTLTNGTHWVTVRALDTWGNMAETNITFNVETGTPTISLNTSADHPLGKNLNQSNITPYTGLNFTAIDGGASTLKNFTWTSSCNSTINILFPGATFTIMNLSLVYPFNYSACRGISGNQTVNVTVNDFSGNSKKEVYQFFVDDVAPEIVIHNPRSDQIFNGLVNLNGSFMDRANALDRSVGYYLGGADGSFSDATIYNLSIHHDNNSFAAPGVNITFNVTELLNFTVGTHYIKFTINDSVGNRGNSSPVRFVVSGEYEFNNASQSLEDYFNLVFQQNYTNVSVKVKTDTGTFAKFEGPNTTNNFYEITFNINLTNISISDFNGTKANWNKINFTPVLNESRGVRGIIGNFTATLLSPIFFNASINEFIADYNAYYGRVELPINISLNGTGTAREIWWLPNTTNLTTRVNVSKCAVGSAAYTRTDTTPCFNYTAGGKTIVFVPHYSHVTGVNDTEPPNVTINRPTAIPSQDVIIFSPNVTVSSDAKNCSYVYNHSITAGLTERINMNLETLGDGTHLCTGPLIRNLTNGSTYNITYFVYDTSENLEHANRTFTVNDTTVHTAAISTSGISSTGATITATANESINFTLNYGTTTALGTFVRKVGFSPSNSTALSSLSASTLYYFNVTTCDRAGNCLVNGTLNFTTSSADAAAAAATTSSSSSSGGGGAVPTSNIAASAAKVWSSITPEAPATVVITKPEIAVSQISIEVGTTVSNVEIKVEALKSNPKKEAPATKVYQYIEITKSNLANADIKQAKVSFKVAKSWLSTNGVAEDNVALYRFSEGWNQLKTTKTGDDGTNALYEAETPGFSTFAVGTKTEAEKPAEAAPTPTVPTGEVVAPPVKEKVTVPEVPKPTRGKGTFVAVIIAVLVLAALLVGYWYKKKGSK